MWIYTQEALTGGQTLDREHEEYLRKLMLCTNCVCAGTFVDHEWVSSRLSADEFESNLGK